MEPGDTTGDRPRDLRWVQLAVRRQNPIVVLIELPDDSWAHVFTPIVKLLFELVLDDCALFFHDKDLFEPLGKVPNTLAFERPGHGHLVKAYANVGGVRVIDSEIVKCLAHVEIGFAGGHNAEARPRAVDDDTIEAVCAGKGEGGVKLVFMKPIFLVKRRVRPADIEPAWRHLKVVGL